MNSDREVMDALQLGWSNRATAEYLGIGERSFYKRIAGLKRRGKLNANKHIPGQHPGEGREITRVTTQTDSGGNPTRYSIMEKPITEGQQYVDPDSTEGGRRVRLSTYRGADGGITGQWDIRAFDKDDAAYLAAKLAMVEELKPLPPVALQHDLRCSTSLINAMVLSDAHIGGLGWGPEVGADWDLKIAERTLTDTFRVMIDQCPSAHHCFLTFLGDWLHYDKSDPMTTLSGNILAADGRQEKMIDVAIRVARRVITAALESHQRVTLLIAEGNHDIIGAIWLRKMFAALYEEEPRLTVVDSPLPYYAVMLDDVFLGFHHGHIRQVGIKTRQALKSAEQLVAIFADEFAPLWGQTTKRYIHTGHLHTKVEVEPRGAQVIQHPTIAVRDDFASRHGWGSLRNALGITYHQKFGETARNVVSPEMLKAN